MQQERIRRIVVLDTAIRARNLRLGCRLGEIRHDMAGVIPGGPDGYLFLAWREDPHVHIGLDISGYPLEHPAYLGQVTLGELSDSLVVTDIVML